jgi:DNA-binding XRE family transcriptional regulator
MVTFESFKQKALANPEVKEEYEILKPVFEIKKQLIKARLNKGLTQEEVAKKMHISKSNISRLESLSNKYTPNLGTLIKYANALNCKIDFRLI